MSGKQPVEVLLRPAVELYTVAACAGAAFLSLVAPWSLALSPAHGRRQCAGVLRLRCHPLPRCPRHPALPAQHSPLAALRDDQQGRTGQPAASVRGARVSVGAETHPSADADVPTGISPLRRVDAGLPAGARRLEERLEFAPFPLSRLPALTGWDVPFNPVRPLPPVGGLPRLHGIEPDEVDVEPAAG